MKNLLLIISLVLCAKTFAQNNSNTKYTFGIYQSLGDEYGCDWEIYIGPIVSHKFSLNSYGIIDYRDESHEANEIATKWMNKVQITYNKEDQSYCFGYETSSWEDSYENADKERDKLILKYKNKNNRSSIKYKIVHN